MELNELRVIAVSRLPYVTQIGKDKIGRVLAALEKSGAIEPQWTSTGRGYLSIREFETVMAELTGVPC